MKNYIDYYYGFSIYDLLYVDGKYTFKNENSMYLLEKCYNSNIFTCYLNLKGELNRYKCFFNIVPNIEGKLITVIDGKTYILLRIGVDSNRLITMFDLKNDMYVNMTEKTSILDHSNWIKLWEQKIDYVENWFAMKNESFQQLSPALNYFIGVSENALLYLKITEMEASKNNLDNLVIQHNRVDVDYKIYDYYDPTKLVIDHPSRDICEYIKSSFLNNQVDYDLFEEYLKKNRFSKNGLRLMYARILFPTFFFDYVERKTTNDEILDITCLEEIIIKHQDFLRMISELLNEKYLVPTIKWIIKKV